MKHTYLFKEGLWKASGDYIDENGGEFPVEGQSVISHNGTVWKLSGWMRVLTDPLTEFQGIYEIKPFEAARDYTQWSSQNSTLGALSGSFVIIKDSLLSLYTCANGEFTGTEYLRQIDENAYYNRGVLMKGALKISSWCIELRR